MFSSPNQLLIHPFKEDKDYIQDYIQGQWGHCIPGRCKYSPGLGMNTFCHLANSSDSRTLCLSSPSITNTSAISSVKRRHEYPEWGQYITLLILFDVQNIVQMLMIQLSQCTAHYNFFCLSSFLCYLQYPVLYHIPIDKLPMLTALNAYLQITDIDTNITNSTKS